MYLLICPLALVAVSVGARSVSIESSKHMMVFLVFIHQNSSIVLKLIFITEMLEMLTLYFSMK